MGQDFNRAHWIWRQGRAGHDEFCDFVTTFTASAADGPYHLHIAADSNYTLWLNGDLCTFGQYADYPTYKVYDRVDITSHLREGENRLVLTVWYYGAPTQTYCPGEAGVIFEIFAGDGHTVVASDEHILSRLSRDYRSGECRYISRQLGFTYHYDLTGDDGFRAAPVETAAAAGFSPSRTVDTISTDLHIRPNEKLRLADRMPARICRRGGFTYTTEADSSVNMAQAALVDLPAWGSDDRPVRLASADPAHPGVFFVVDLGEESAGFLDIDLEVPAACRVDVGYGEHLIDGVCRTAIRGFSCDLELAAGRNTYLHTFRRFGCRYLQFFVHAPAVTVHYAGLRPVLYPLQAKNYQSGNPLRDTIYRVCQNTLRHCLHEHYEDCPWREQALYTLDSRNQMLCGYYAFGETRAPRAALELIAHGLRPDGLLMLCYPAGVDFPIPAFSLVYFLQMEEYIRYSGDTTLARRVFPVLCRLMETFHARLQPDGVIENFYGAAPHDPNSYWNFYEWADTMSGKFGEDQRRLECPLNCFYSLALEAMAKICEALDDPAAAAAYRGRRDRLNAAIVAMFYNPRTTLFESFDMVHRGTYSVLTQSLAVLCGAARSVDLSVMLPLMAANGAGDWGVPVVPNTLSMNGFRFDALLAVDREAYAPGILAEIDREYGRMLQAGATTFWETAKGAEDFGGAGSLCHGWSALPIYYYEVLCGAGDD